MRVIKNFSFVLLLTTVFCVQQAAGELLPESSYYDGSVSYLGSDFGFDGMNGRIDYAVYDTVVYQDEFIGGMFTAPGDGRYIYAYQIFTDEQSSFEVSYFALFGADGDILNGSGIFDIGSQSDEPDDPTEEGVAPSDAYFHQSEARAVWEFNNFKISAGDQSFFLVYSSDNDWTAGSYEIKSPSGVPTPNPEPTSVLLLGIGSLYFLAKRKRTV